MIQPQDELNDSVELTLLWCEMNHLSLIRELTGRFDYRVLKRLLDVLFSIILLILAAPLLLLISGLVKASSTGPILFRQRRVGLNHRIFWMYKFRTMKNTSASVSEQGWTLEKDARVTGLGRILRHCSFDELPQLFNVIKGDMSWSDRARNVLSSLKDSISRSPDTRCDTLFAVASPAGHRSMGGGETLLSTNGWSTILTTFGTGRFGLI